MAEDPCGASWSEWVSAYERVWSEVALLSTIECPACRRTSLSLIYEPSAAAPGSYTEFFWCNDCLCGLPPNRAVPADGAVIARDAEIPDFRTVQRPLNL